MWFWLGLAIVSEVSATLALRSSEGFTRIGPAVIVVAGYGIAFYGLSRVLSTGMAVGVAYGIWAAVGVALIAVLGAVLFGDGLSRLQVGGIALVILGVLALELGGSAGGSDRSGAEQPDVAPPEASST